MASGQNPFIVRISALTVLSPGSTHLDTSRMRTLGIFPGNLYEVAFACQTSPGAQNWS